MKLRRMCAVFLSLGLAVSCNSSEKPEESKPLRASNQHSLFDVPALIGKNIDDVRRMLGNPADKRLEPTDATYNEWDNRFHKAGYTLLVTFNPKTREVIDFFLPTKDASGKTTDYNDLLNVSNTKVANQNYFVTPVAIAEYPGEYTGIKIKKK
jgi:hypothetical protein